MQSSAKFLTVLAQSPLSEFSDESINAEVYHVEISIVEVNDLILHSLPD